MPWYRRALQRPYSFLTAAAVLALLLCLFPVRVDAPEEAPMQAAQPSEAPRGVADAVADLSARTQSGTMLHRTLYYAPCGHSVQRREPLPSAWAGLTRGALEEAMTGMTVTGFSAQEVDATQRLDIPCPLHWVLRSGEDSLLHVLQNRTGESLESVRRTDIPLSRVPQEERDAVVEGRMFDDVQAIEGYLESLSS